MSTSASASPQASRPRTACWRSWASERYAGPGGLLVIGADVVRGVEGLARDDGPPEKVLEHLCALARLARARRAAPLGMTQTRWLEQHNISVSRESESIRTSAKERQQRSWPDGRGRRIFDLHTKPSDGNSAAPLRTSLL